MAKKKAQWIVEIYDPTNDVLTFVSEPMSEVASIDLMIKLDRENPTMAVSSRKI